MTAKQIAEKCLNQFWNPSGCKSLTNGWDNGSPAHKWALKWAKKNIRSLNKKSWKTVYNEYLASLRQE